MSNPEPKKLTGPLPGYDQALTDVWQSLVGLRDITDPVHHEGINRSIEVVKGLKRRKDNQNENKKP